MALLVPNTGEVWMLQQVTGVNNTKANTLYIKLYTNNKTPGEGDIGSDYTEASFSGYANLALTPGSWTITSVSGYANATYAVQTFTSDSAQASQSVYGYYITSNVGSQQLVWAERFTDGPYTITNNGDSIKITPFISLE